ncbi:sugar phosphate isomerase/epimerase family protein [Sphingomonas jatrophae]|uniref:sugar phosphate isomerase/epimerase family protein n=1 Tax=Sphingomonas jatrophae TaxID=1166337 RepID=UPI0013F4DBB8|nr:sugar phosphate isomerase/epimerase [Sphingomonas jatrophae]
MRDHRIGLASGVLPEFDAEIVVDAAAEAGFDAVGLWVVPDQWPAARIRTVRAAVAAHGLELLDIEVLRMRPGPLADDHRRMVEIAGELGARNLLVVGGEGKADALVEPYAELCALGAAHGVRIALEFMLFSRVRTLDEAAAVVAAAQSPAAALLIDPLHLDRAGYDAAAIAALPTAWLSYAQFCDAPAATLPVDDSVGLLAEAKDDRLLPGEGVLPLHAILDALPPATPLSIELRSRALRETYPDPLARAHAVRLATAEWLGAPVAA